MNLKTSPRGNRKYLSIVHGFRDRDSKIVKTKTIKSLGYLDELEKIYEDPIAHFKEVARKMTEEEKERRKTTIVLDMDEELPAGSNGRKNLGYAAILKIYHELELDRFFNNKARHHGFEYNTNSIMTLLVVSRLLSPGSKKKAFEERGRYFERFDFSLTDVYRSLSHFATTAQDAQRHINERVSACYGRDSKTVYYDVTNFYFHTDQEDNLRKIGVSKERRRKPIVQMGLAMDADGVPLHYELFPGNAQDKSTFRSVIGEVRRNYDTGRIVVVADMGIITGDNIFYLVGGEKREKPLNGYVFSFSVRGGTDKFKEYVLDRSGYRTIDGKAVDESTDFMIKSRRIARDISVTMTSGKTEKKTVYEKQVVFWGAQYAAKAKSDREKVVLKANNIVGNPQNYTRATSYGAAKYVKNIAYDKKTGEVVNAAKTLAFDWDKVNEEEKYDGYYSIVTSELGMSDQEIIDTYRGLWEIEETFRITKGALEARPVYVSLEDRVNAHFLTCFIALVIIRLLQKQTGGEFSCEKIVDCLNQISGSNEQENIYLFDYRSPLSDAIGAATGIDFSKKRVRLGDVKNIVAKSKK